MTAPNHTQPSPAATLAQLIHECASTQFVCLAARLGIADLLADSPPGRLRPGGGAGSLRSSAIMYGEEWHWRPFGELMHSVVTGETAFDHVFGRGFFDYLGDYPRAADAFDDAMTGFTQAHAEAAVEAYDFSGMRRGWSTLPADTVCSSQPS